MIRNKMRTLGLAAGLLLLYMVPAACSQTTSATGDTTPVKGGIVIDAIGQDPNSLLPQRSNQTFSLLVQTAIRTPLFATDDKGGIVPVLAMEVPSVSNGGISADGLTYTFHIRSGTKWSDGQPVTAADVLYTINLFRDPGYSPRYGFQVASAEMNSVTQPDADTIVIKLKQVDAGFLARYFTDVLSFAPLPQHVYGAMAPAALIQSSESFKPTVTNGPFKVSDRLQGDSITVVRDPRYVGFGTAPHPAYLDKVVFKVFRDTKTIVTSLHAGQVDTAYFLPVTTYESLKSIPGYTLKPSTIPNSFEAWYLNVNGFQQAGQPAADEPLSDPVVREALAISFDTKQEIQNIWHGLAQPTCDESVGTFGHDPQLIDAHGYCAYGPDGKSFDNGGVAAANAMLDADGWVKGSDGIRVKNGHRLSLRISTTTGLTYREDSEALAQAAWKNIGVALTVNNYPSGDLFGPILFPESGNGNTQFDIAEYGTGVGVDPDNRTYYNSAYTPQKAGGNPGFYQNAQVDQLTIQQAQTPDQNARKQILTQIHQLANKDVPIIWLYAFASLNEASDRLHNYKPSGVGPDETWNVADWWLTGGSRG